MSDKKQPNIQEMEFDEKPPEGLSKNQLKKWKKKKFLEMQKKQHKKAMNKKKSVEILDPKEYYNFRVKQVLKLKELPKTFPYPHKFSLTHRIKELVNLFFDKIETPGHFEKEVVRTAGRVTSIRKVSTKLYFLDMMSEDFKIQLIVNKKVY